METGKPTPYPRMKQNKHSTGIGRIPGLLVVLLLFPVLSVRESQAQVNLAIDTGTTYQTCLLYTSPSPRD